VARGREVIGPNKKNEVVKEPSGIGWLWMDSLVQD
jgi:hypothetical protein